MNDTYEALEQVQSVRAQLKDLTPKAKGKLADSVAALDKKCAQLVGATQSGFYGTPPSGKQPENFSTLNQHFAAILATADSADAAPTTQANAAFHELQEDDAALAKQWSSTRDTEIPELNRGLKKAGFPEIDPRKPLAEKPGGVADGDDEP
jgi:hypothetical protein